MPSTHVNNSAALQSADPILRVTDLSVCFQGNNRTNTVVDQVSFELSSGEFLALVGESGSGKSVTALSVLQLLDYRSASHPTGEILYRDQNIRKANESSLRKLRGDRIAMIFQEPMTSLNPLHTVEKQIGETLLLHKGLKGAAARQRIIELLELVGIPEPTRRLSSYPHQLSGGQKQRVMIAMALANEPDILIADEPTTALDVTVQKQVLELLKSLQHKLGMALLFITHDLSIVRHYADQVIVMQQGRVVERGETRSVFSDPQHPYTRKLLSADPSGEAVILPNNAPDLLTAHNISVRFSKKKTLLGKVKESFVAVDNVELKLREGETLGVVGESGSGKTTLGLALLKLVPSEGQVSLRGHRIDSLDQKQFRPYRRTIQVVFQDPYGSLSPRMSVAEIVGEGLAIHGIEDKVEQEERIVQSLQDVGLDPAVRHRYPHEFSGGQRQRIAIARAIVLQPDIIILDEPTSALDRTVQAQVVTLLRELQRKYRLSYIFISHDLGLVRALSHRVMVLKDGHVVEQGNTEALFEKPAHPYTRELLDAALFYQTQDSQ